MVIFDSTRHRPAAAIRGEGSGDDGTMLVATLRKQHNLFSISGAAGARKAGAGPNTNAATQFPLLDAYVPVGAQSIHVGPNDLRVGDAIELVRPGTAAWIHELGMDRIPIGKNPREKTEQWKPQDFTFAFERTVVRLEFGTVFFDAPLPQSIDRKYGGGFVRKSQAPKRVTECGIENLRLVSEYDPNVTTNVYRTIAVLDDPPTTRCARSHRRPAPGRGRPASRKPSPSSQTTAPTNRPAARLFDRALPTASPAAGRPAPFRCTFGPSRRSPPG